jgi:hypothetical protein
LNSQGTNGRSDRWAAAKIFITIFPNTSAANSSSERKGMHFSFLSVRKEQACPFLNDAAAIRVRQPVRFNDR